MNVFVLDHDIERAARAHMDAHANKMCLETAQILCTAAHLNEVPDVPYRKTHTSHPCVLWAAETQANFEWLCHFGLEVCKEKVHRWGKEHGSQYVIEWALGVADQIPDSTGGERTPFAQAMPARYKIEGDAITAYRCYYATQKTHLAKWTEREPPHWWVPCHYETYNYSLPGYYA